MMEILITLVAFVITVIITFCVVIPVIMVLLMFYAEFILRILRWVGL